MSNILYMFNVTYVKETFCHIGDSKMSKKSTISTDKEFAKYFPESFFEKTNTSINAAIPKMLNIEVREVTFKRSKYKYTIEVLGIKGNNYGNIAHELTTAIESVSNEGLEQGYSDICYKSYVTVGTVYETKL